MKTLSGGEISAQERLQSCLHQLKHFLPAQSPLKDFIHHNTLHAFQHLPFYEALSEATSLFGYKVYLSLNDYREAYLKGHIDEQALNFALSSTSNPDLWRKKLLHAHYHQVELPRIGQLKAVWLSKYRINFDKEVHPFLFRLLSSYLDQGISIWNFPGSKKGFFKAVQELEKNSHSSLFETARARKLLLNDTSLAELLGLLVGHIDWHEQYLFDQQFAHPGWSGMISVLEDHPEKLLDQRKICLEDFIRLELLMEINFLDKKFGSNWKPLSELIDKIPQPLFSETVKQNEKHQVLSLWQDAMEWSFYRQVIAGIKSKPQVKEIASPLPSFQAIFCIDDRECSLRRYIEQLDPQASTYGTPGFFNVACYYQPAHSSHFTKICPAPMEPLHLIKELEAKKKHKTDRHLGKSTYGLFGGLLISQTLGFASAFRLLINIFKPVSSPAMVSSFRHMDPKGKLTVHTVDPDHKVHGLQVGYTYEEMAEIVEGQLRSIGLCGPFGELVYVVGHGASSVNNTHYAGYDCGACSGRPGSVNARAICQMANTKEVRETLLKRGIDLANTVFVPGLHDTTRDEMQWYDTDTLNAGQLEKHRTHLRLFEKALHLNARERSRRFVLMDHKGSPEKIHADVKLRSVSLFEPRPELNHATNAVCIIGRRELSRHLFLDRRSFMNSYDYRQDPDGNYLYGILKAAAPVCGGINLEYYFSRTDQYRLGAGTKLPHNVMGLIGVANGLDGDLRPGLPTQMVEVHDPLRLLIMVEQKKELIQSVIQREESTYEWFKNQWVHLVAVEPETLEMYHFKEGEFTPLEAPDISLPEFDTVHELISMETENLPVASLKS
jgi:uncharacterized protein